MQHTNPQNDPDPGGHSGERYSAVINGKHVHVTHRHIQVPRLLEIGGFAPPDDWVLIRLEAHRTIALRVDETIGLSEDHVVHFHAFKTDCVFRFLVGEHEFDWGEPIIAEPQVRAIAHVKEAEVLVVPGDGECGRILGSGDVIDLRSPGTAHLRVESRMVTVFFKDEAIEIARGTYTVDQLKEKFPIEPGYLLLVKKGDELIPLKPNEKICVHECMHFYSQVPGGGSS